MEENVQAYIYEHIPIVQKNAFAIETGNDPYVAVAASLRDHFNHRNTAFGGSLSTSLILCSWASVRSILKSRGIHDGSIVIQSQTVDFFKPVTEDFTAQVTPLSEDRIHRFVSMLEKFGKSRLKVEANVMQNGDDASRAKFVGEFVVLRKEE